MRHLLFLSPVFSAREEFVSGYGTEWMALLSKIKKRNERRRKGKVRKSGRIPRHDSVCSQTVDRSFTEDVAKLLYPGLWMSVITVGIVLSSRASAQCENVMPASYLR